jgi:hypothetical protein
MRGKAFLTVARELASRGTEAHWRSAAGRAYDALFLEGRDALTRWGFVVPKRDAHAFTRLRFDVPSPSELKPLGQLLDFLVRLRNAADYDLSVLKEFTSDAEAQQAVQDVSDALTLLDAVESDPTRRAAAIAAIQAAFP